MITIFKVEQLVFGHRNGQFCEAAQMLRFSYYVSLLHNAIRFGMLDMRQICSALPLH